jgi:hypothetical protein
MPVSFVFTSEVVEAGANDCDTSILDVIEAGAAGSDTYTAGADCV